MIFTEKYIYLIVNTCSYKYERLLTKMLTKIQLRILKIFTSRLTGLFSIRDIAKELGIFPSSAHRAIQPLIKQDFLVKNEKNNFSLNFRKHHDVLAYVEYLKRNELLSKPKNKALALFADDLAKEIKDDCFMLILFGSAVNNDRPNDIDILLVIEETDKVEFAERFLHNICDRYNLPFHPLVVSFESVYEMLAKREHRNVFNELLNKHIILYGSELFYRLVDKGRV